MASFRDQVLLELSDPANIAVNLLPAGDTVGGRVRTMLGATYDLTSTRIDQIKSVAVTEVALQRPLFPVGRRVGSWSQTVPSFTRTDFTLAVPAPADPLWIDLLARVDVTVVAETDPSGAESVLVRAFADFTTLDEFRARFLFIDLDDFMARHHITTVEELREAFDYLVADIRLRRPAPFDPADPANTRVLPVTLAIVVDDPLDLALGLRATRLIREAARDLGGATPTTVPTEILAPYATAVVVASTSITPALTAPTIEGLFAREGVVTLFQKAV